MRIMLSRIFLILVGLIALCRGDSVCNVLCDGVERSEASGSREAATTELFSRKLSLRIADKENMAFAILENGDKGDEVWMDRSFDGAQTWDSDSRIGMTRIESGSRSVESLMYNVDDPSHFKLGAVRVCGKAGNRAEIVCSPWARSRVNSESRIDGAATALMQYYDYNGNALFRTTGWWNTANSITALIDYGRETGSSVYNYAISRTFEAHKKSYFGNFTNGYIDDTLWWGLAWTGAYELTGDEKYLKMAMIDADYAYSFKDSVCRKNGKEGIWWHIGKTYKNAITNELFIKLAAWLHNVIPGDRKYLSEAVEVWNWFKGSGMINGDNLVNDGLTAECQNNNQNTWSYNQGVILGGLAHLHKATGSEEYLSQARKIADAVLASRDMNRNGVLIEPCGGCGGADVPSFKGAFIRNLGELNRVLPGKPYSQYLKRQTESLYANDRNSLDQYGLEWPGPFAEPSAASQHSALEAFTAAHGL